jgi:hypothetical protein
MILISGKTFNSWTKVPIKANKLLDLEGGNYLLETISIFGKLIFWFTTKLLFQDQNLSNLCPTHSN